MPNWCDNVVTLTHNDKTKIDELEAELENSEPALLQHLRPYDGEWDYGWCVENWGTKWEANVIEHERIDDNTIRVIFETAWGPPLALYEFLEAYEWNVEGFYHEPGVCFAGIYAEGYNDEYDFSDMTADEIEENLPHELNEMYGISTYKREWEEENEEGEDYVEYSEEQLREDLDKIKLEVDENTESWPNPAKKASDQ